MISIIIPTFNEDQCLPILLESIKQQSFSDYEVIVADNNSTDDTVAIAKKYGATVTSGGLPGPGRNAGAKIAKGDILLFLDADVLLKSRNYLYDCITELDHANFGIATCYIHPLTSSKLDIIGHEIFNQVMRLSVKFSPYAPGFCIFAKKSVHDTIHGFDERILLAEDTEYVRRASRVSEFGILKSHKIYVSVRRLDRDGRLNVLTKYLLCAIYMATVGNVTTNIFNYSFGHKKK
jgi:glycosyltransferase involved in cell wall biosynthesis